MTPVESLPFSGVEVMMTDGNRVQVFTNFGPYSEMEVKMEYSEGECYSYSKEDCTQSVMNISDFN